MENLTESHPTVPARAGLELIVLVPLPHPQGVFPVQHPYLEECWLPSLGPTSTLLLRRLNQLLIDSPEMQIPAAELGNMLGVGGSGATGMLARSIDRLVRFRLAAGGPENLTIHTDVPLVGGRLLERLPAWSRARHDRYVADQLAVLDRTPTLVDRLVDRAVTPPTRVAPRR